MGQQMNLRVYRNSLVTAAVAAALLASRAWAVDVAETAAADTSDAEDGLQSVIVTGTRQSGIKAIDSPAPIQIISNEQLQKASSSPDLLQTLATLIPSFSASTFGGDLSNLTLQAKLRGLSPNDTLILVNGKRRHTTGSLSIGGGSFEGGAGADLNFIPVDAIDHIEVLTDGAAAQYGSDAIAGVINIILKKDYSGGNLQATYGAYEDGGGVTDDVDGNIGFQPYDGAYVNFTGEFRNHGFSFRGAPDPRTIDPTSAPNTNEFNAPGYPYLNRIGGDSQQQLKIFSFNSGFKLGDAVEFYSFGSYGKKEGESFENYRPPSTVVYSDTATDTKTYQFPYGFSPQEAIDETDYQINAGLKGVVADWNWDLSSGYGRDFIDVSTINTTNLSLYALNGVPPPSGFYDGSFKATQWTSTIDLNRDFDIGLAGPLNVAFGGEYRRETFALGAGVPGSYYGAGAASYPGFNPVDAGIHSRTNDAAYIDLASKVFDKLRLDAAGRFEHYSDFGDKTVGKLTGRYDFTPEVGVRGTVSTGFRAPTLAEEYYTTTNVSPTSAVVQLAPNSPGAKDLGLGSGLQPETSTNYSFGTVFTPVPELTTSLDLFYIIVKNRIVPTGTLNAALNGVVVAPEISQAIIDNGNSLDPEVVASGQTAVSLFTNGVNTKTKGADFALDYITDLAKLGKVDWSIGATYNDTTAYDIRGGTPQLAGQPLLNATAISYFTTASPRYVLNLGALWSLNRLSINVHEVIYGNSSEETGDSGYTDKVAGISPAAQLFYQTSTGVLPITNVDVSYNVLQSLKLSVGAENVFNRYPDKVNAQLLALYNNAKILSSSAVGQYSSFSSIGIDGGFYYLRATYTF
jgi:iron complex outermembrane receptor protein